MSDSVETECGVILSVLSNLTSRRGRDHFALRKQVRRSTRPRSRRPSISTSTLFRVLQPKASRQFRSSLGPGRCCSRLVSEVLGTFRIRRSGDVCVSFRRHSGTLQAMIHGLLAQQPADPLDFMVHYLKTQKRYFACISAPPFLERNYLRLR